MAKHSTLSDRKVAANRANSTKSTGPQNTSSTRYNAVKHGLLSVGITELDDADGYRDTLRRLTKDYAGEICDFLIWRIALQMARLRRIARLEAGYITAVLNPPLYGEVPNDPFKDLLPPAPPLVDPGLPAAIDNGSVEKLVSTFQRYESSVESKLYRAIDQLEQIRQIQQWEHLTAPSAIDVAARSDHHKVEVNPERVQVVPEVTEPSGPEVDEAGTDASVVDSSGDAQPSGTPSGTDGNPSQEPPLQAAAPDGSEDEHRKPETGDEVRGSFAANAVCDEGDLPEDGETAT